MTEKCFTVREATVADIPALAALGAELVRFHQRLDPRRFEILSPQLEAGYARFLESRVRDPQAVVLLAECASPSAARAGGCVGEEGHPSDSSHSGTDSPAERGAAAGRCMPEGRSAEIVGYAFGQVEGPSWPDLLGVHGRFHDLMVRADRRRLGIGAALVEAMVEHLRARGAPRVVLMTAWANSKARSFFEKLGFRPTMVEMVD